MGLYSLKHELAAETGQEELLALVRQLNADPAIHGILVQSPPPPHIDEAAVVEAIDPRKDVDGFHPLNVAKLAMAEPGGFVPCTPLGCQRLLIETGIETAGARVVVLGRSMIVGKPLALLLMGKGKGGDATVTVAHSRSRDLEAITREADILIAAIGRPEFVKGAHVREGGGGDRRGDQPQGGPGIREGVQAGGRRGLRKRGAEVPRDHPGARRRGTDDHRDADSEYFGGVQEAERELRWRKFWSASGRMPNT